MALEPIQNIKTDSPANQPEFKQLIIPGMEELSKKLTPNLNSHLVPPRTPPGIQIPG